MCGGFGVWLIGLKSPEGGGNRGLPNAIIPEIRISLHHHFVFLTDLG